MKACFAFPSTRYYLVKDFKVFEDICPLLFLFWCLFFINSRLMKYDKVTYSAANCLFFWSFCFCDRQKRPYEVNSLEFKPDIRDISDTSDFS